MEAIIYGISVEPGQRCSGFFMLWKGVIFEHKSKSSTESRKKVELMKKFMGVDLIQSLKVVLQQNTGFYQPYPKLTPLYPKLTPFLSLWITFNHSEIHGTEKIKMTVNPVKSRFTAIFLWAGDERIELPPKVLETPIIPFDQSPVLQLAAASTWLVYQSGGGLSRKKWKCV